MAARKIKVVLNTDPASSDCGKFKAEADGYKGKGCSEDLAFFENLGHIDKQIKKPEYRQLQTGTVNVRV